MEIRNPILRGLHPDPSVCCVDGVYYLVNSTFEYVPGVPVFRSRDLVDWEQIGHCITRSEQLDLSRVPASGGIFAPTIRWHEGLFYVITTSFTGRGMDNFFVTAADPAGPWSDPVRIDIQGIDPSIYWEDGRTYVHYAARGTICQVEIDGVTGAVLDGPRALTDGTGGRDAEGPHMWVRDGWHYLMLAEGGTREGHMVTLLRGRSVWGPFEPSPYGPVVTNRERSKEPIQRTGHADLVTGPDGREYLAALGVRSVKHRNLLGRETVLAPVAWTEDGWLRAPDGGRLPASFEAELGPGPQRIERSFALDTSTAELPLWICSPRKLHPECLRAVPGGGLRARGCGRGLDDGDSCFWAVRQPEFEVSVRARIDGVQIGGEADEVGLAVLITQDYHLSMFLTERAGRPGVVVRRRVGDIDDQRFFPHPAELPLEGAKELAIEGTAEAYSFRMNGVELASSIADHVTCEVAGTQNTGVVDGFFVSGAAEATVLAFEVAGRA